MALSEPVRLREEEEPKEATEEEVFFRDELGGAGEERLKEEEAVLWAKLGGATGGALRAGVEGALELAPPPAPPAPPPPPRRARSAERQIFSSGWTLGLGPAFPVGVLGLGSCF